MEMAPIAGADKVISRNRDEFLRELLSELAKVLESRVGLEAAEGFIGRVGSRIGETMNEEYRAIFETDALDVTQVAQALVDLKERIEGAFKVESISPEKIVLVNSSCPFAGQVEGRESLCMMTTSVFGRIAASNLGYARVEKPQTIARGDLGCRVIVHLTEGEAGREYFG
ncbi:methanogen output domain 1-containing protein [Roseovarius sp. MMSF_3298]|uniref:methanogen output domain 1-containing protein n=2 Tax=unclassified Roseovarius TaxID=2614913 RepID=UPI00273FB316|nr:methanogen output domain 1-containing protein [Roseovarius sp. MMSF_3298]